MASPRIAGALVVAFLAGCSVEEPERPLAVRAEGKEATDSQTAPVIPVVRGAVENAGLRADFNAP